MLLVRNINPVEEAKRLYEFIRKNIYDKPKCIAEIITLITDCRIEMIAQIRRRDNDEKRAEGID